MKENILIDKSIVFASRIVKLHDLKKITNNQGVNFYDMPILSRRNGRRGYSF